MILKDTLRSIVKSQRDQLKRFDYEIKREKFESIKLDAPFAIIISGIRRCGKSTLMRHLIKRTKGFYYFNFEDIRAVNFEAEDFQKLDDIFKEEFGEQKYYFFDEIQSTQKTLRRK